jgi:hypothetical protein
MVFKVNGRPLIEVMQELEAESVPQRGCRWTRMRSGLPEKYQQLLRELFDYILKHGRPPRTDSKLGKRILYRFRMSPYNLSLSPAFEPFQEALRRRQAASKGTRPGRRGPFVEALSRAS